MKTDIAQVPKYLSAGLGSISAQLSYEMNSKYYQGLVTGIEW